MKNWILTLLLALAVSPAHAGNEGPHGGDMYAREFTALAAIVAKDFRLTPPPAMTKWSLTADQFDGAIKSTWVVSAPETDVAINGNEVDATNAHETNQGFPYTIRISRERWREADLLAKLKLVVHEYFGVLNIERDSYPASLDFAGELARVAERIRKSPEAATLMVNLFYGHSTYIPRMGSVDVCDYNAPDFIAAVNSSRTQAQNKCAIAGGKSCAVVDEQIKSIVSSTMIGFRYCDIEIVVH